MNFIKPDTVFDFVSKKKISIGTSLVIILLGIASIFFHHGLNMGIEFTGGTLVQVKFDKKVSSDAVRDVLLQSDVGAADVQEFGAENEDPFGLKLYTGTAVHVNTFETPGSID